MWWKESIDVVNDEKSNKRMWILVVVDDDVKVQMFVNANERRKRRPQ